MELQNQAMLWSEPELVGWVEKRVDKSLIWNRRFFLLQGPFLFYYIKNTDILTTVPVGVIPLEGAFIKDGDDTDTGRRFCFHLRLEPEVASFAKFASYHISAPSQEAKMVWMHAVQLASFSRPFLLE